MRRLSWYNDWGTLTFRIRQFWWHFAWVFSLESLHRLVKNQSKGSRQQKFQRIPEQASFSWVRTTCQSDGTIITENWKKQPKRSDCSTPRYHRIPQAKWSSNLQSVNPDFGHGRPKYGSNYSSLVSSPPHHSLLEELHIDLKIALRSATFARRKRLNFSAETTINSQNPPKTRLFS